MTDHMPKFSIIIPVYNVAPYLRECLDSVMAQTFTGWEAICVDDGSTDESGEILDEYAAGDRRIRVVHLQNDGVSAARNRGLESATAEWLMFLDSDDRWSFDLLERIVGKIEMHQDADIITYAPIIPFDSKTGKCAMELKKIIPGCVTGEMVLRGQTDRYINLGWHACDKVYRREMIEQGRVRFNREVSLGEDALFVNMLFARAKKVVVCDDIRGYFRRIHEKSAMRNISLKMWTSQVERFVSLHRLWRETRSRGVLTVLKRDVWGVLRIGLSGSGAHRPACINFLVSSRDFNFIVVGFLIKHGTLKQRLVAMALKVLPCRLKVELLQHMR